MVFTTLSLATYVLYGRTTTFVLYYVCVCVCQPAADGNDSVQYGVKLHQYFFLLLFFLSTANKSTEKVSMYKPDV